MLGYVRYVFVYNLPIGIKVNINSWVRNEPDSCGDWAKVSFSEEDVGYSDCGGWNIYKGTILELA